MMFFGRSKLAASGSKEWAGEGLLKHLRAVTKRAVLDYRRGTYSGHPEEQLEFIEVAQNLARKAADAKKRSWTVSEKSVREAENNLDSWLAVARGVKDMDPKLREKVLSNLEEHVGWARRGLI